jgi:hypothetical protein
MRTIDCTEFIDLAAELALGNLCGDDRANALAHVERCASCRHEVNELTSVTDRLLLLGPCVEPPPGFEQRVIASLGFDTPRQRRTRRPRRRWATVAAAAAFVVAFATGGIVLDVGSPAQPALAAAEMRTPNGELVGEIFLGRDDPTSLFMTLPGWAEQIERRGQPADYYAMRIETDGGEVITRPVELTADATWATTLGVGAEAVRTVALVSGDGHVWCEAEFESSANDR